VVLIPDIAKKYRQKINPINSALPDRDIFYIKESIIRKVRTELLLRISKGYENINVNSIEEEVDKSLKAVSITY